MGKRPKKGEKKKKLNVTEVILIIFSYSIIQIALGIIMLVIGLKYL